MRIIVCLLLINLAFPLFAQQRYTYDDALQYYQQANPGHAKIVLRNILRDQPDNLAAQLLFGTILFEEQDFLAALTVLEDAVADGADVRLIADQLSYLYLITRNREKIAQLGRQSTLSAQQEYGRLLVEFSLSIAEQDIAYATQLLAKLQQLDANNPKTRNASAELAIAKQDFVAAKKELAASLQLTKNEPSTYLLLGNLANLQNIPEDAVNYFVQGLSISPADPFLLRALSATYFNLGQLEETLNTLQQLAALNIEDSYLRFALPMVTLLLNQNTNEQSFIELQAELSGIPVEFFNAEPSQLFLRATVYFINGNEQLAQRDFEDYLKLVPGDLAAINALLALYKKNAPLSTSLRLLEANESVIRNDLDLSLQHIILVKQQGRVSLAQEMYNTLRARFPLNSDMLTVEIALQRQQGAALPSLESEGQTASSISLLLSKTLLAKDQGNLIAALEYAAQLRALQPNNPDFINLQASLLLLQGNLQQAKQKLQPLIAASAEYYPAQLTWINILLLERDFNAAQDLLNGLIAKQPAADNLQILLAQLEFSTQHNDAAKERLHRVFNRSASAPALGLLLQYYQSTQAYNEALLLAQQALRRNTFSLDLRLLEAELLVNLGRVTDAQQRLVSIQQLAEMNAPQRFQMAMLLQQVGHHDAVIITLTQLVADYPQQERYQLELAQLYLALNELTKAEQLVNKLAVKSANHAYLTGVIALQKQQRQAAFNAFSQAVTLDKDFLKAWAQLYELARDKAFDALFQQLALNELAQNPTHFWLQRLLAEHSINHLNYSKASELYKQLLSQQQYTDDAFLYNNLANALLNLNDNKAALGYAETAWGLNRGNPRIVTTYAKALFANADYPGALQQLRQAYTQQSDNIEIQLLLAETLTALSRFSEAQTFLLPLQTAELDTALQQRVKLLQQKLF